MITRTIRSILLLDGLLLLDGVVHWQWSVDSVPCCRCYCSLASFNIRWWLHWDWVQDWWFDWCHGGTSCGWTGFLKVLVHQSWNGYACGIGVFALPVLWPLDGRIYFQCPELVVVSWNLFCHQLSNSCPIIFASKSRSVFQNAKDWLTLDFDIAFLCWVDLISDRSLEIGSRADFWIGTYTDFFRSLM